VVVREIIFNYHCAIRCVVSYINVAFFFFFFDRNDRYFVE
jgi:hypothetical protein